ncbi:hypothetical protein PSQ20_16455 [Curvibacter sp. RS43]|uniref:hypothetical protein n=1 Tax=Curvibacter microcysteis TaxID=3026419 RepID=UPI00235EF7F2|nr:hypothetical protein [Curvibacter sp. RS43]MDD0811950.1 hypothetical protein [Curvibacter sp. RS43]
MKVQALVSAALVSAVLSLTGTAFAQTPAATKTSAPAASPAIVAGPAAAPAATAAPAAAPAVAAAPTAKAETSKTGAPAEAHSKAKHPKKHAKAEAGKAEATKPTPAS